MVKNINWIQCFATSFEEDSVSPNNTHDYIYKHPKNTSWEIILWINYSFSIEIDLSCVPFFQIYTWELLPWKYEKELILQTENY